MASLKELKLTNDAVGSDVDFDNLPKQGGMRPLLPPGTYRFQLPKALGDIWDSFDIKNGPKAGQQRVSAVFDAASPLVVIQSTDPQYQGFLFQTRVNNMERKRGKDGPEVSDFDYLLKALGFKKPAGKRLTNLEYIQALLPFAGKDFTGKVEWQWQCNAKKDIWVDNGQGGTVQVEGKLGCGSRYYQNDIEKVNGAYPERITCGGNEGECGASLRALEQFGSIG